MHSAARLTADPPGVMEIDHEIITVEVFVFCCCFFLHIVLKEDYADLQSDLNLY